MGKRRQRETPHAEGQHGPETHARHLELLNSGPSEPPLQEILAGERQHSARDGKSRLVEDRQQHDEGEKNSERTRVGDVRPPLT